MIDPKFDSFKLNDDGQKKADEIGVLFTGLLRGLKEICPEGREFSVVQTKLEEASFFAKKSIALDPSNTELQVKGGAHAA